MPQINSEKKLNIQMSGNIRVPEEVQGRGVLVVFRSGDKYSSFSIPGGYNFILSPAEKRDIYCIVTGLNFGGYDTSEPRGLPFLQTEIDDKILQGDPEQLADRDFFAKTLQELLMKRAQKIRKLRGETE